MVRLHRCSSVRARRNDVTIPTPAGLVTAIAFVVFVANAVADMNHDVPQAQCEQLRAELDRLQAPQLWLLLDASVVVGLLFIELRRRRRWRWSMQSWVRGVPLPAKYSGPTWRRQSELKA